MGYPLHLGGDDSRSVFGVFFQKNQSPSNEPHVGIYCRRDDSYKLLVSAFPRHLTGFEGQAGLCLVSCYNWLFIRWFFSAVYRQDAAPPTQETTYRTSRGHQDFLKKNCIVNPRYYPSQYSGRTSCRCGFWCFCFQPGPCPPYQCSPACDRDWIAKFSRRSRCIHSTSEGRIFPIQSFLLRTIIRNSRAYCRSFGSSTGGVNLPLAPLSTGICCRSDDFRSSRGTDSRIPART